MIDKEKAAPWRGRGFRSSEQAGRRLNDQNIAPPRDTQDAGRAAWAALIAGAWRKSAEAFLETGRRLAEAKADLPHGAFLAMIENDLPFGARMAQMMMAIARNPRLANAKHISHLPPHVATLYQLTKISDERFEAMSAAGDIRPELERRELIVAQKRERRAEREIELGAFQTALPQKRFGVVYADPAWRWEAYSRVTGLDSAPESHYPTMTPDAIKALDVAGIAEENSVLFLWATVPALPQALETMVAWGFTYKSGLAWAKDRAGTGYWFRNQHEHLLLGTRGQPPAPALGTQWSSLLEAAVRGHSCKPDEIYALIEAYFPNLPKVELFARHARPGWNRWGAEAPEAEAGAAP